MFLKAMPFLPQNLWLLQARLSTTDFVQATYERPPSPGATFRACDWTSASHDFGLILAEYAQTHDSSDASLIDSFVAFRFLLARRRVNMKTCQYSLGFGWAPASPGFVCLSRQIEEVLHFNVDVILLIWSHVLSYMSIRHSHTHMHTL